MLSPSLFNIFFAAVIEVVLQCFREDDTILENLVFLDEGSGGGPDETRLDQVRRAVWGMLYADDAGIVSRSPAGLARMMTVIVEVFCTFGLAVSEKKTETLLTRAPKKAQQPGETPTPPLPALEIAAAGQKYHQVHQFVYLGDLITEDADIMRDINRRTKLAWGCFRKCSTELFDRPSAPLRLKARLLKAEAMEALLYGCRRGPRVTLTIGSSGRRTTSSFCGSPGTTAFTAHIEIYRTLKPSRKPGAKVWKRQFASDGFCSQGPWPGRVTSDSRSGCCSPRDSRGWKTRDPASRHNTGRKA